MSKAESMINEIANGAREDEREREREREREVRRKTNTSEKHVKWIIKKGPI
jgi:hypothetical protein